MLAWVKLGPSGAPAVPSPLFGQPYSALTKAIAVGKPMHGPTDSKPRGSSSGVDNKVANPRVTAWYGELH